MRSARARMQLFDRGSEVIASRFYLRCERSFRRAASATRVDAGDFSDDCAKGVLASATLAADSAPLQLLQTRRARSDRVAHIAFRSSPADTDDHCIWIPHNVLRLRLSLNLDEQ